MKSIYIFSGISLIGSCLLTLIISCVSSLTEPLGCALILLSFLIPTLAHLLTCLWLKESPCTGPLKFNLHQNTGIYLKSIFISLGLVLLGACIYFIFFPHNLDVHLEGVNQQILAQSKAQSKPLPNYTSIQLWELMIVKFIPSFITGTFLQIPLALLQEFGWRAYLLPKCIQQLGQKKGILLSGFLLGLYFAPLALIGNLYGISGPFYPFAGILGTILFYMILNIYLSYLSFNSKNIWASTFAHAAVFSAFDVSLVCYTAKDLNYLIGPLPCGILGGMGLIGAGIYCWIKLFKTKVKSSAKIKPCPKP